LPSQSGFNDNEVNGVGDYPSEGFGPPPKP